MTPANKKRQEHSHQADAKRLASPGFSFYNRESQHQGAVKAEKHQRCVEVAYSRDFTKTPGILINTSLLLGVTASSIRSVCHGIFYPGSKWENWSKWGN